MELEKNKEFLDYKQLLQKDEEEYFQKNPQKKKTIFYTWVEPKFDLLTSKKILKQAKQHSYEPYNQIVQDERYNMEDLSQLNKSSIVNSCVKDGNNYILPKGTKIYKGVKYFYTEEQERQYFSNFECSYFGDKFIALKYANLYNGGLHVYEAQEDIKLFNANNEQSIEQVINEISKDPKYKKLEHCLKVKYGVGMNRYEQFIETKTPQYSKSKYDDNNYWLYSPVVQYLDLYRNNHDNQYTKWVFEENSVNKTTSKGLLEYLQGKFDGIITLNGFFTPYVGRTVSHCEIILQNVFKKFKRAISDNLDSDFILKIQHLPFEPEKIDFNYNKQDIWTKNSFLK